jgi:hypothetical protein
VYLNIALIIIITIMNAHEWMAQYNTVKRDIVSRRQAGKPVQAGDQRNLTNVLATLEKELKTMAQSPMEYDLYVLNSLIL